MKEKILAECAAGECEHGSDASCLTAAIEVFDRIMLACSAGAGVADLDHGSGDAGYDRDVTAAMISGQASSIFESRNEAVSKMLHKSKGLHPVENCDDCTNATSVEGA